MNQTLKLNTPESISSFVRQFQEIRILLTAYELDIFSLIGPSRRPSKEIAVKIKADARATDRLLNALAVMGLLAKNNGKFSNTETSANYLVKGEPGYISGLMHHVHLWDSWSTLTECVRTGTSVIDHSDSVNDRDTGWLKSFIAAMHYRAKENAQKIIGKINLTGVRKILDVGGGSGVYAMAFVNAADDINATVFDLPNVIPLTKEYIHKERLDERIDTATGDYNVDDLPKGYDLIFLSAIVHSNSFNENQELVRKCAASLNTGGRIVIKDQVMDDSRTQPARGALFALNMLVNTRGGDTFTEKEIREWLDHSGIRFEERIDINGEDTMVIGRKI